MVQKEKEDGELDRRIEQLLERIDNLDTINIKGTKRVHLVRMVSKYAFERGITHPEAWNIYKQRFNIAFKTNLRTRIYFCELRNDLIGVTMPVKIPRSKGRTGLIPVSGTRLTATRLPWLVKSWKPCSFHDQVYAS